MHYNAQTPQRPALFFRMSQAANTVVAVPELLTVVGKRIRRLRAQRGMTRSMLASASGISLRYLADLEAGRGNPSLLVLQAIAVALHVALDDLADPREHPVVEYRWLRERLREAEPAELRRIASLLSAGEAHTAPRHIALLGLRGAGKSTLGQALAKQLGVPFVELVQEIERRAGKAVSEILEDAGQTGYRELEYAALEATLARFDRTVIAVGGSLVSEPATYERLLRSCYSVWLRATPQEHMQRVLAQGDHRPMADNRHAMADLKRILAERGELYARASATVDTAGLTVAAALEQLLNLEAVGQPDHGRTAAAT